MLIHVPPGFDPAKPFRTLLFFHGHGSRIETTIAEEYRLIEQANRSGRNLILVAPQLARDTRDSHPGKLAGRGAAARLLSDALGQAAELLGVPAPLLAGGQVIVAAYSGGWWPAAETLTRGGLDGRIAALFLLDAQYGGDAAFADWIAARRTEAVFVSIHTGSSAPGAERLLGRLIAANVEPSPELPGRLRPGTVVVAKRETPHLRVMVEGPPALPVAALLRRLPAFSDAVPDPADPAGPPEVPDNRP